MARHLRPIKWAMLPTWYHSPIAFTMARLMIVGDSHVTRVQDLIETGGYDVGGNSVICIARGGLRAEDARAFLQQKKHVIRKFRPTDVIIHVGVCDLLPKSLQQRPGHIIDVMQNIFKATEYLWDVARPRVYISSFLPHVIRPREEVHGKELASMVKRQLNYNVWLDKWLVKTQGFAGNGCRILNHGWAWASRRHAKRELYDLSGSWYGLHLNRDGTERLLKDFLAVVWDFETVFTNGPYKGHHLIQRDNSGCCTYNIHTRYAHQHNKVVTASFTPPFTTTPKQHTFSLWLKIVRIV